MDGTTIRRYKLKCDVHSYRFLIIRPRRHASADCALSYLEAICRMIFVMFYVLGAGWRHKVRLGRVYRCFNCGNNDENSKRRSQETLRSLYRFSILYKSFFYAALYQRYLCAVLRFISYLLLRPDVDCFYLQLQNNERRVSVGLRSEFFHVVMIY